MTAIRWLAALGLALSVPAAAADPETERSPSRLEIDREAMARGQLHREDVRHQLRSEYRALVGETNGVKLPPDWPMAPAVGARDVTAAERAPLAGKSLGRLLAALESDEQAVRRAAHQLLVERARTSVTARLEIRKALRSYQNRHPEGTGGNVEEIRRLRRILHDGQSGEVAQLKVRIPAAQGRPARTLVVPAEYFTGGLTARPKDRVRITRFREADERDQFRKLLVLYNANEDIPGSWQRWFAEGDGVLVTDLRKRGETFEAIAADRFVETVLDTMYLTTDPPPAPTPRPRPEPQRHE